MGGTGSGSDNWHLKAMWQKLIRCPDGWCVPGGYSLDAENLPWGWSCSASHFWTARNVTTWEGVPFFLVDRVLVSWPIWVDGQITLVLVLKKHRKTPKFVYVTQLITLWGPEGIALSIIFTASFCKDYHLYNSFAVFTTSTSNMLHISSVFNESIS
jgi:hypothetical protein